LECNFYGIAVKSFSGIAIAGSSFVRMSLFMSIELNRRTAMLLSGAGFGTVALAAMLADEGRACDKLQPDTVNVAQYPLTSGRPHFPARAKRVIFLFMPGGPSQVDTFDPKPRLTKENGQPSPKLYLGQQRNLLASPWKFQKYGQSGLEVSDLFPQTATCIDDICVIRSMVTDDPNHPGGCLLMNTGERVFSRPSVGAWVTYGLGTMNKSLPSFVVMVEGVTKVGTSGVERFRTCLVV
jgi:hypothetical protein